MAATNAWTVGVGVVRMRITPCAAAAIRIRRKTGQHRVALRDNNSSQQKNHARGEYKHVHLSKHDIEYDGKLLRTHTLASRLWVTGRLPELVYSCRVD